MNQTRHWFLRPSTILAFLLGVLVSQLLDYWWRLWRQPGLVAWTHQYLPEHDKAIIEADPALHIAEANVRAGIEERHLPDGTRKTILWAGWRNFREPWARDFGFASFGLVELAEKRVLKETLELYLHYQRADGHFPVKIHSTSVVDRYLHSLFARQQPTYSPLRPKYHTAHRTISLDGNSLLVIAALNYLRHYQDEAFAHRHWAALKRALHWVEAQALRPDGLLHQGAYTDWADSVIRTGAVHYTNVLYWKAVREFALDAARYGFAEDERVFKRREEQLRQAINHHFWDGRQGFYITSRQFPLVLSSDGNLLAAAWKLATPEQANAILDNVAAFGMAEPVPTKCTNREYGREYIAFENRLGGIPHYHTSAAWLWLGSWHVIALVRAGRLDEAERLLDRMRRVIVRDGVVHEVYDTSGHYLKTRWYQSEAPLTWSASMFVYASAVYRKESEK
jgi:GH15 family glucan-1,4-alpha-glucosidase